MKNFEYFKTLLAMAVHDQWKDRVVFLTMAVVMVLQNLVFFGVWLVFFDSFSEIRGWTLEDIATLFGVVAFGFGLVFFIFGGTLDLGRMIREGELDVYLGRPKSKLLAVMMREGRPAGLGDMATAPILWFTVGGHGLGDLPILLSAALLAGLIHLSVALTLQSLPFFAGAIRTLPDQLFELFLIGSLYPQHGHGILLRAALFTVIPAGFAAYLPVVTVMQFEPWKLIVLALAAGFYFTLAVTLFHRGVRRYSSGGGWIGPR